MTAPFKIALLNQAETMLARASKAISTVRSRARRARAQLLFLRHHPAFRKDPLRVLLRLAVWRVRSLLPAPVVVSLLKWDLQVEIPARWRGPGKTLYVFREDYDREIRLLTQILRPGQTLVDIGANLGIYSLVGAKTVGRNGRVIAMEPAQETFKRLKRNIDLNAMDNITPYRAAASECDGQSILVHHADDSRNALGDPAKPSVADARDTEEIQTRTLDSVLAEMKVARVDVIKIDVEGAEELVLRGAQSTLVKDRPIIIFEWSPKSTSSLGLNPYGAWHNLRSSGYGFHQVDEEGQLERVDGPKQSGNYVAVHEEVVSRGPLWNVLES